MDASIEHRLIRLLRDSPLPTLPVRRLHTALVAETGPAAGTCSRLVEHLQERGDVFVVVEPEHPLGPADGWPAAIRGDYETALLDMGIDAGPFVTLAPRHRTTGGAASRLVPGVADPSIDPIAASLADIWDAAADRPDLRRAIVGALIDYGTVPDPSDDGDPVDGEC